MSNFLSHIKTIITNEKIRFNLQIDINLYYLYIYDISRKGVLFAKAALQQYEFLTTRVRGKLPQKVLFN